MTSPPPPEITETLGPSILRTVFSTWTSMPTVGLTWGGSHGFAVDVGQRFRTQKLVGGRGFEPGASRSRTVGCANARLNSESGERGLAEACPAIHPP
jgi:hypothetical protein